MVTEQASGDVDGVNRVFASSARYVRGSMVLFVNGMLRLSTSDDGFTELGGRQVELIEAPRTGDVVQMRYRRA